jgi:colanic acid biosynthesis glycosyl transferase WcaI
MRIAYLVQQFPPEVGAGPARVLELAQRWRGYGSEVTVLTGLPSRMVPGQRAGTFAPGYGRRPFMRETWEDLDVLRSWCYSSPAPGTARTIANNVSFMITSLVHGLVRLPASDVLIASSPPFFPHITGRLLAASRGAPLVLELRDLWPDYLVGMGVVRRGSFAARRLFALESSLLRSAAAVVVVTDTFRERVIEKGVHPDRFIVVPNGVDMQRYGARATDQSDARSFVAGYLGNFGAGQDLTVAVRAAALLRKDDVRIELVGDGPDRARIESEASAAGLANLVIRGSIPKERTEACYHSFDICLVPLAPIAELQETIPSKIFEIMACERPVLASAAGETQRLVESSGCGLVVPPGDADALAAGIRTLRDMTAGERRELGRQGRSYVGRHYSRDDLARAYHDLLLSVARQAQQRGRPAAAEGGMFDAPPGE